MAARQVTDEDIPNVPNLYFSIEMKLFRILRDVTAHDSLVYKR